MVTGSSFLRQLPIELYSAVDLFLCRMTFSDAAYQFERTKRIEALTSVRPDFFTLPAFRYCPYPLQETACRGPVRVNKEDRLSFRQ